MISTNFSRRGVPVFALCVLMLFWQGCGGGGGSGGPPGTQPSQSTTRTPPPDATPPPTPNVVRSGASIADSVKRAPAGSTVIVSPGVYAPIVLTAADVPGSITLLADVTGSMTESPPAPVTIVSGGKAAISITGVNDVTIDGFTLSGGTAAVILVIDSPGITVQNCVVKRAKGDGVQFRQSDGGLLFNDLIWDNHGAGIRALGSNDLRVINNTVYGNAGSGISVEPDDAPPPPTPPIPTSNIEVTNSIFNANTPAGISVDASVTGFQGNFNYNTDGYVGTDMGPEDVDPAFFPNPLFFAPGRDDNGFHLQVGIVGSTSPAVGAGDSDIDPGLLAALEARTTQPDGTLDTLPVDLGYHYLSAAAFATPTPKPRLTATRTPTVRGTPTRTATRTPSRTPTP